MHVNFKIYKDSFISRAVISESANRGKKVLSITDNDATFKYLHSTWIIDPLDKGARNNVKLPVSLGLIQTRARDAISTTK